MEVARDPVQFVYDNFNNVKMDKFDNPSIPTDEMQMVQHPMMMPNAMHNSMSNIPNSIGNNVGPGMGGGMNPGGDQNMAMNNNGNGNGGLNSFNDARGRKRVAITEEYIKSVELDNLEGVR